jgi:class 3 adenylate cyclase
MSGDSDEPLKARRSEITVVYIDLRGFTGFTETAEPEEVMSVLRQYHSELGRIITEHDGTIEHFAGDGLMVLFNAPMSVENHELWLCGEAKDRQILIAPRILAKIEAHIEVEDLGEFSLKGFHRPIPAYNVLTLRQQSSQETALTAVDGAALRGGPAGIATPA